MMTAELLSHGIIDLRVVLDARMPAHSTQQTDPAHTPTPQLNSDVTTTTSSVVRIICLR